MTELERQLQGINGDLKIFSLERGIYEMLKKGGYSATKKNVEAYLNIGWVIGNLDKVTKFRGVGEKMLLALRELAVKDGITVKDSGKQTEEIAYDGEKKKKKVESVVKILELERRVFALEVELERKSKVLQYGQTYWYLGARGIMETEWTGSDEDKEHQKRDNIFASKEQADARDEIRLAVGRTEMPVWTKGIVMVSPDGDSKKVEFESRFSENLHVAFFSGTLLPADSDEEDIQYRIELLQVAYGVK